MIPTAIIVGLIFGRLWAVPLASVVWLALLAVGDSCLPGCGPEAAGLAALNALGGVAVRAALARVFRRPSAATPSP
jgi:hypothetical protein